MGFSSSSSVNRRQALRLLTSAAGALTLNRFAFASKTNALPTPGKATSDTTTVLTPELTQGPYYIDLERVRRNITEGKSGVPLRLQIQVLQVNSGGPVAGAAIDLWHCDAQGVYSGFTSHGFGPGGPPPPWARPGNPPPMRTSGGPPSHSPGGPGFHPHGPRKPDNNLTFLRGVQLTNSSGMAEFETIFPGWYLGRTTHIHLRVHDGGVVEGDHYRHGHVSHTGQIFFPEAITDKIYRTPAYMRKNQGRVPLEDDGIFRQGGSRVASLTLVEAGKPKLGYVSRVTLIVDPAATAPSAGF